MAEDLASFHALSGNAEETTVWLQEAFSLAPTGRETRILDSDLFDPVRSDAGFAATVRRETEAARARLRAAQAGGSTPWA